ncbi:MAG: hypothetical protein N2690_07125, partial [Rhodocyclaceae bacterium]|nr:hypothetical protein [Rhodocyclaceae bacterium]
MCIRDSCERMFRTHQARLPKQLAAAGITDMAAANQYLREVYLPAFNAEFKQPAMEEGSAFVPFIGSDLDDILCEQYERVVGKDNCVAFEGLRLQITKDRSGLRPPRLPPTAPKADSLCATTPDKSIFC